MSNKSIVGILGEDIACKFLIERRYKILYRNYREKFDEIDIIAKSYNRTLSFLEVKTLQGFKDGLLGLMPEDHMNKLKYERISRASRMFVAKHIDLIDFKKGWQIDLLAINLNIQKDNFEIVHYENINPKY